jgi:GNAT superfamily N-acetyltransferase
MSVDKPIVRNARPEDVPQLFGFVVDLAEYERAPEAVVSTADMLRHALFPTDEQAHVWAHVVVDPDDPKRLAGAAIWHLNFSTWEGHHGIYVEDIYVRPELRGSGYGRALLASLAKICFERGYPRLQWSVLDWNKPSLDFYRNLGAQPLEEWVGYRLQGNELTELASG